MAKANSDKKDPNLEPVDGPSVAAKILQAMPMEHREKLLKAIEVRDPELSIKVTESMFNFNDIEQLTAQGVQVLIANIDQNDLVLSFKLATEAVKATFLSNMSERKAKLVTEDVAALGKVKRTDVEDAQRRILKTLDELRTSGQIRSQSKNDLWV